MKNNYKIIKLLIITVFFTFALSSCTTNTDTELIPPPTTQWDALFVNTLNPDPSIMHKLDSSVQDINLKSSINGVTVHVKQTLGDAKTLYIAFDVIFPDDINAEFLSDEDVQSGTFISSLPGTVELFEGKIDHNDIKEMNVSQVNAKYSSNKIPFEGNASIERKEVDVEKNSMSYLLSFNSNNKCFDVNELTLLIEGFNLKKSDTDIKHYSGLHAISWPVENTTPIMEKEIFNKDQVVGSILLSPFSFTGTIDSSDYKTAYEFHTSIQFIFKDGRILQPETALTGKSGSFDPNVGSATRSYLFTQPVDVDNVDQIKIGGFTVDLKK